MVNIYCVPTLFPKEKQLKLRETNSQARATKSAKEENWNLGLSLQTLYFQLYHVDTPI